MNYKDILDFWFEELTGKDRFMGGEALDRKIAERFSDVHAAAAAGEYESWREVPEGALAEIIILDQFSRNLFRGKKAAFATDAMALELAQVAIEKGFDQKLDRDKRLFLYMPYMHSESKEVHQEALKLFTALGNEESRKYEIIHKEIIDRFGRYPHRNKQLDRESTPEEIQYLEESEESFFKS